MFFYEVGVRGDRVAILFAPSFTLQLAYLLD